MSKMELSNDHMSSQQDQTMDWGSKKDFCVKNIL